MPPATLASILRHIRNHARIEASPARPGGGRLRAALALFTLAVGPGLSGCILGSERPDLNLDMSATYRAAPRGAADAAVPAVDWWRGFRSSELTSLMDAAQVYNLDIAVAVAEIVQADAQVGVSGAPLLPSVTGTASAERQHVGSQTATTGTGVTREDLAVAERILTLSRNQFNGGTASQLDLSQQEALVATQRAALPPLEVTLGQNIAALALLVARAPANFTVHGG